MIKSTSAIRVSNHNNWPVVELFPCEKEFIEQMARHNIQQIFVTANLEAKETDETFNAAVGHILDCLDSLPRRPDAAFDSLYKVIDQNLNVFSKPNTSRMLSVIDNFFQSHPNEWSIISQSLVKNIPQHTADYAASRILDCHVEINLPHTDELKKRSNRSLGRVRYKAFCDKFLVPNPQNPSLFDLPYDKRRNAGRLMRLLFTQERCSDQNNMLSTISTTTDPLNLSDQENILSPKEKLHSLMEICLATYRHERFHGEAFSPFRSSKAKLKTYAHAYYVLIVSYVIVLGMLHAQNKGSITISDILNVAQDSMQQFSHFFGSVLDE